MQTLVSLGTKSVGSTEQLFMEIMKGPVSSYFNTNEEFDRSQVEQTIES